MKPKKICRRSFITAMALAALFAFAAASPCAAAPPAPKQCGLIGTWYGHAYSSLKWLGVHTAGSTGGIIGALLLDDTIGEMLLNWVFVADGLLDACYSADNTCGIATSMTPGHGVWQQTSMGQYNYTWYAYGIDDSGNPVFSVRVRGTATNTDCNNVAIVFTYEVFKGLVLPQNMSASTPVVTIPGEPGKSGETRVPLVTP